MPPEGLRKVWPGGRGNRTEVALILHPSMNETWSVISSGLPIFPLFVTATIFGWLTDQIRRHGSELSDQRQIELAGLVERQRDKDRELERLRILSRMAAMLNQTLDYQRVLGMASSQEGPRRWLRRPISSQDTLRGWS